MSIRAALETYRQSVDAFAEAGDEPAAKDYEYRDDDAVAFAAEAEPWIAAALEALEPEQIEKIERRLTLNRERSASQGGTS